MPGVIRRWLAIGKGLSSRPRAASLLGGLVGPCTRERHWGLAAAVRTAKAVRRRIAMTSPAVQSSLLTPLISSAAMRAILDDRARVQRMLDFEVALARAEAAVRIVRPPCSDRNAGAPP